VSNNKPTPSQTNQVATAEFVLGKIWFKIGCCFLNVDCCLARLAAATLAESTLEADELGVVACDSRGDAELAEAAIVARLALVVGVDEA
jgi:hypothetical protein